MRKLNKNPKPSCFPISVPSRAGRRAASLALLALLICALVGPGCNAEYTGEPVAPMSVIDPDKADWYLISPPLEQVRVAALRILVNVEGLMGVIDLVRASLGVDLADESLLVNLGLADHLPALVLGHGDGVCLAVGVTRPEPLRDLFHKVAETSGYTLTTRMSEKGRVELAGFGELTPAALLETGGMSLIAWSRTGGADRLLAEAVYTWAGSWSGGDTTGEFRFYWKNRSDNTSISALPVLPGALAGLSHWYWELMEGVSGIQGTLTADEDGLDCSLEFLSPHPAAPAQPVSAQAQVPAAENQDSWRAYLPDDSVLLVELARSSASSLGDKLGGKWRFVLGLLLKEAGLGALVEDILPVLEDFRAELGFVFLGFDPAATMSDLTGPDDPMALLAAVHMGLLLRGDLERVRALLPSDKPEVKSDWQVEVLSRDAPLVLEACRNPDKTPSQCLGFVQSGERLMILSGKGEAMRVLRVMAGKQKSYAESLFVKSAPGDVVAVMKMKRLVRDMGTKGVPPYYLRMVNSFLEMQVTTEERESGHLVKARLLLR